MQHSISYQTPERPTPKEPNAAVSRLRIVTGNRFPRKCACGCGAGIPRDPGVRYVVDFGAPRPYPAFIREHSPDFGSYRGPPRGRVDLASVPGFVPASALLAKPAESKPPVELDFTTDPAHSETDASPSVEAGRPCASGQLVFNAGSFESARSGFADYAKDSETGEQLRTRVNRIILEDLEQKVLALRSLHAKFRDLDSGESFAGVVARSRPL